MERAAKRCHLESTMKKGATTMAFKKTSATSASHEKDEDCDDALLDDIWGRRLAGERLRQKAVPDSEEEVAESHAESSPRVKKGRRRQRPVAHRTHLRPLRRPQASSRRVVTWTWQSKSP
eukprot:51249-Lingulodinium_polyedra.AAC.1